MVTKNLNNLSLSIYRDIASERQQPFQEILLTKNNNKQVLAYLRYTLRRTQYTISGKEKTWKHGPLYRLRLQGDQNSNDWKDCNSD